MEGSDLQRKIHANHHLPTMAPTTTLFLCCLITAILYAIRRVLLGWCSPPKEEATSLLVKSVDKEEATSLHVKSVDKEAPQLDSAFVPGQMYHSTQVRGSDGNIVGVGAGYIGKGRYKAQGSGRIYDMNKPPPGDCFNCGGNHWRVNCPYARGNSTV